MTRPPQILFIPDEMQFGGHDGAAPLLAAISDAIQKREASGETDLPIIVSAPADLIDKVRLVDLNGSLPERALREHADSTMDPAAAHRLIDEFMASAERLSQCGILFMKDDI